MMDTRDVDSRMKRGDGMRTTPQRFVVLEPRLLCRGQDHGFSMPRAEAHCAGGRVVPVVTGMPYHDRLSMRTLESYA